MGLTADGKYTHSNIADRHTCSLVYKDLTKHGHVIYK